MSGIRSTRIALVAILALLVMLAAVAAASSGEASAAQAAQPPSKFFDQAEYNRQLALRSVKPTGPAGKPWIQAIKPKWVDTSKYKKAGGWKVCFSNASVSNPWRVVGWKTMQEERKLHPRIKTFKYVDAEGQDAKQISDISDLLTQHCDALIISPNTTGPLTTSVKKACATGVPVIVFDRGVTTNCPTTFIHPIGGYAYGAYAADFICKNVKKGGKVLALRILPGVDVLENRWSGGSLIMKKCGLKLVANEFTGGDPAKTKQIVTDYIQRLGSLDGVWMDAGATSVAAIEAFQDAGMKVPPITGEDQNDFLQKWQKDKLKAAAPTYPPGQWRTALIAADWILSGKKVPKEWILPQPFITDKNLKQYIYPKMPPLFYATCWCDKMPNFPKAWQG